MKVKLRKKSSREGFQPNIEFEVADELELRNRRCPVCDYRSFKIDGTRVECKHCSITARIEK